MATRKLRNKDGALYFATFACHQWLDLFVLVNAHDLVNKWMHIAYGKGYHFLGYAIMPNHAHFVVRVPENGMINTLPSNGKRFMAYDVIKRLQTNARGDMLARLQEGLRPADRARGQKHRVFATSTDLVELYSGRMIERNCNTYMPTR